MRFIRPLQLVATLVSLVAVIFAVSALPVRGQSADPATLDQISSQRYIVIDDQTGEIYAEKDADTRAGMASVTKVFTAIVVLERAPLDMQIVGQESDLFDSRSTKMTGFFAGGTYTVRDLLYGMILESGNDAAQALARGVGAQEGDTPEQSVERFVGWMNDKVADLGLTNTHFVNPHGLSDPDHYTTPRDIAMFMMYAVQNPDFMALVSARTFTTTAGDTIASINRGPQFIPDYVGGKTGYDDSTGYCLVEIGQRGDVQLVSVTIDGVAPDVWYQDHAILQEYGFAARADRIASGEPLGDNVVAFSQQVDQTQPEVTSEAEVTPAPDTAFAGVDTGPRPVLISGTPAPAAAKTDESGDTFDNWLIGSVILVIVFGTLWMRSGANLFGRSGTSSLDDEIDT